MNRTSSVAIALLSICATLHAQTKEIWTLTSADFQNQRIRLRGIDDSGIRIAPAAGGADRTLPFDQFLQLDRASHLTRRTAKFIAKTTDGDAFAGEAVSTSGDTLNWTTASLGPVKLSLRKMDSIARISSVAAPAPAESTRTEDVILLLNGDSARGVLASLDSKSASIQPSAGGDATIVPVDSIAAIYFASTAISSPATQTSQPFRFRVSLSDGTSVRARSLQIKNDLVQFGGQLNSVKLDAIESIEQINGPVIWLSSLTPTEIVQSPFLEKSWPTRMNESASGGPIHFGQRVFSRGIGVHSYSRIAWPIDPKVVAFRTQYAIDGALPYADVTVRIKLDGKTAYEQKNFRAGMLSQVVTLDTNHAATITLEVDYGENADVQDRFNWIEPVLLKYKPAPATQPATQPTAVPSTQESAG